MTEMQHQQQSVTRVVSNLNRFN